MKRAILSAMAYRDRRPRCPVCATALPSRGRLNFGMACARCGGTWVDGATLARMWGEAAPGTTVPALVPRRDRRRRRPCASCGLLMTKLMLHAIPLDGCEPHGLWFDPGGLDRALASATLDQDRQQPFAAILSRRRAW
jgi:Zn-finger nucleic acid-binding protein